MTKHGKIFPGEQGRNTPLPRFLHYSSHALTFPFPSPLPHPCPSHAPTVPIPCYSPLLRLLTPKGTLSTGIKAAAAIQIEGTRIVSEKRLLTCVHHTKLRKQPPLLWSLRYWGIPLLQPKVTVPLFPPLAVMVLVHISHTLPHLR